jgi:hypothetical protein
MVAPPLLAVLIGQAVIHRWQYVPAMYFLYCMTAMLALSCLRETRDLQLHDLGKREQFIAAADAAVP